MGSHTNFIPIVSMLIDARMVCFRSQTVNRPKRMNAILKLQKGSHIVSAVGAAYTRGTG